MNNMTIKKHALKIILCYRMILSARFFIYIYGVNLFYRACMSFNFL